jgi:ABC-type multidrug transport system fused ATPase/permease subunit
MAKFNLLYSLIVIASYIPIALCDQIYIKKIYSWQIGYVGEQRKMGYVTSLISQKLYSESIRIFGIAEYLLDIYTGLWKSWFATRKKIVKKWSAISLVLSTIPEILTVLVLLSVGMNIINGKNSIGDFSLYSGIIGQLVASVFLMTFNISRISENKVRIKDYRDFNSWINQVEGSGEVELKSIKKIVFKNVSFTYPGNDRPTLKNLSFELHGKERVSLVGINGAGKTTLVKLLLRLYDATEGEIMVNGMDIKKYTPESIRKRFSVMFQDYVNYAFTLRENIRISDISKKYTDDDLLEACKKAGATHIIESCENGLDSFIYKEFEENGIELSGGENQKIALCRTFFRDSEFIILDEPSSALDAESENTLFEKMIQLCNGKGVILISHRLTNVILADRILVIEGGELIEQGSHNELMKKNGRYATLFRYQAERYNIA